MTHGFNHVVSAKSKDEWLTPPPIIKALGDFDLDPCSPINRPWPTAKNHFDIRDNGLAQKWHGRVWCNPPYGNNTFDWIERLADHGNGIALIFARTETKGFFQQIWQRADAVLFLKGRLAFYHVDGSRGNTANAPSCLVAYGAGNVEALRTALRTNRLAGALCFIDGWNNAAIL